MTKWDSVAKYDPHDQLSNCLPHAVGASRGGGPARAPPTPCSPRVLPGLLPGHLRSPALEAHRSGLGSLHFVPGLLNNLTGLSGSANPHSSYTSLHISHVLSGSPYSLHSLQPSWRVSQAVQVGSSVITQLTDLQSRILPRCRTPCWAPTVPRCSCLGSSCFNCVSGLKSRLSFLTST